jgi:hypothetical protein
MHIACIENKLRRSQRVIELVIYGRADAEHTGENNTTSDGTSSDSDSGGQGGIEHHSYGEI